MCFNATQQAERRALESKNEFEHVSKLVKSEVARFETERIEDFKRSMERFLDGMIDRQKEVRCAFPLPFTPFPFPLLPILISAASYSTSRGLVVDVVRLSAHRGEGTVSARDSAEGVEFECGATADEWVVRVEDCGVGRDLCRAAGRFATCVG